MTARIIVVGLGTGDEQQLTLGAYRKLREADKVYVRTERHPTVELLKRERIPFESFDKLYEKYGSFPEVYESIVDELIRLAVSTEGEIIYAVPGHPMVAETTTRLLNQRCPREGIELSMIGGESFLDQAFLRFGFDPLEGFVLLDATALPESPAEPDRHTLIAQVYDALTASDVKLFLMNTFPDDYVVVIGCALGVPDRERIVRVPLYELDRQPDYGDLTLVWVPASGDAQLRNRSFDRLAEIVRILRSPEGCPWDRAQTHSTIRKNLIEETYEVLETIDSDDPEAMCEELGDLLLQVMLHAQMEAEAGTFDVYDVIEGLNAKLIRRHPHVFGDRYANNAEEALGNWNAIKAEEKKRRGVDVDNESVLAGVPRDLPGLLKAWKLQQKAAQVGFDWDRAEDVFAKIDEEIRELKEATEESRAEELGDLLFSVVNLARFLNVDPEAAIAQANRKFVRRFAHIEQQLRLRGEHFDRTSLEKLEQLWQEAKKL